MTRFVAWIRSVFCRHDFEYKYSERIAMRLGAPRTVEHLTSATCHKCGHHRAYSEFGS